jgi:succinate dehydrogenase / fumarate reductase membrane anchor subunit
MKLKWKDDGTIKSPLSRARGLGAAHNGVHHWISQRVTAIANFGLMVWLMCAMSSMTSMDYVSFTIWLAQPLNALLMIFTVISVFYHAALGAQVVVEDYFHIQWMKLTKLIGIKLFFTAGAIACIFAILKIAL